MNVFVQLEEQAKLLHDVISTLPENHYQQKIPALYHASIGDHSRHIVEILQCAVNGHATGVIDYHNRERNLQLAEDPSLALASLQNLFQQCKRDNKAVNVIHGETSSQEDQVLSTYHRELLYNVEHTIHHMALIKVALFYLGILELPEGFGMAYSTITYKKQGE
ncbi:MAG: hypothetical protein WBP58_08280 [Chitinophagaceae bacterium]